MAIAASSVLPSNSLEDMRIEFNNLVSDVSGITATNKFDTSIIFEGSTADAYETTLTVTDPTADRTITLPNSTGTVTVAGNPGSADGDALGSASLEWSDLYLADGGIIYFGNDQDVTLTHVADTGLLLSSTDQLQFGDSASYIAQSSDSVLRIDGEATIDLNASTAVTVSNDLKLDSDAAVLGFGVDNDVTLTHVADTGLLLNSTMQLQFNDSSQYINAPSATVLDINATDEIELNATLMDINGNVEISGTTTQTGISTSAAKDVFNAGMSVKNGSTSAGFIEFFEDSDNGTNKVTLIGPSSTSDVSITLPASTDTVALQGDVTALAIALG